MPRVRHNGVEKSLGKQRQIPMRNKKGKNKDHDIKSKM
jgi:hypothetical protein